VQNGHVVYKPRHGCWRSCHEPNDARSQSDSKSVASTKNGFLNYPVGEWPLMCCSSGALSTDAEVHPDAVSRYRVAGWLSPPVQASNLTVAAAVAAFYHLLWHTGVTIWRRAS
jgi:hypothetical protein